VQRSVYSPYVRYHQPRHGLLRHGGVRRAAGARHALTVLVGALLFASEDDVSWQLARDWHFELVT
jgi:hypothetical protein